MEPTPPDPAVFIHIKVAIGMVVSLAIASVLTGVARFVQHPHRHKPDWIHLAWALSMLLSMLHFWWWEYRLSALSWRFELYLFVMCFAILYYLMCAVLFPSDIAEYDGYGDYFMSRRRWFFALLAVSVAFDGIDSLLKGRDHFAAFGIEYPLRITAYFVLAGVAAWTANRRFHASLAVGNVLYQLSWILRGFDVLA
ncbi:hypothetical protein [Variovorax sp. 770b2]|jgi:hypothetical protein|uniref:hypothetical protein n=1 Tax=Variovorax sp. 770b2 TaxID=1566271 RepID=UPI0008EAB8ED|nr:hypothetical protein [Variovorax sp. 770b2]SFP31862.1 hypothetical protein SAMN03159339_1670 [Variovorax sp. 770b2]